MPFRACLQHTFAGVHTSSRQVGRTLGRAASSTQWSLRVLSPPVPGSLVLIRGAQVLPTSPCPIMPLAWWLPVQNWHLLLPISCLISTSKAAHPSREGCSGLYESPAHLPIIRLHCPPWSTPCGSADNTSKSLHCWPGCLTALLPPDMSSVRGSTTGP